MILKCKQHPNCIWQNHVHGLKWRQIIFFKAKAFFFFYNITMSGSLIFFFPQSFFCTVAILFSFVRLSWSEALQKGWRNALNPPRGLYFEKFTSWKYTAPLQGRVKEFTDLSPVLLHRVHREERVFVSVGLSVCVYVCLCVSVCQEAELSKMSLKLLYSSSPPQVTRTV